MNHTSTLQPPAFPATRLRRLRRTPALRTLVRETAIGPDDFVYPLFVTHGSGMREEIISMPGVYRWSVDGAVTQAKAAAKAGIPAVLLFGIPASKDPVGRENFATDGIVQQAALAIKDSCPGMLVVTDVCLCEYTDHGHCGVLDKDGCILNDETLEILGRVAVSHAQAGADIVAPSGMMDGMVATIRASLDQAGFSDVAILSYAVKYASAFYGPFREAAQGVPKSGDRKSHQMDPANRREALREARLDVAEGADMLMVKPALAYLDVIHSVKERFPDIPLAAYNVSGEYAMVKAAASQGWVDEERTTLEILTGIKRAGADIIITYHALDAARWLGGI
ncbi:MAG: porphobilinogen synthase [Chloroflexota bacterium]|nr:porphobilinogen synthase [Chloroflexota bacterium]